MVKHVKFNWQIFLSCLLLVCFSRCKEEVTSIVYNPDLPVTITSFTPEEGRANTQLIIYGSNFGSDTAQIDVKVGGKDALLINAKGNCLYCFVPEKSGGKIEVKVGESETTVSEKEFKYEYRQMVTTLCGRVDKLGYGKVLSEGSFDELEKIEDQFWLSFDPQDKNILYCSQDAGSGRKAILKFDLEKKYMNTVYRSGTNGVNRVRTIDWTKDGDMIISTPNPTMSKETIGGILLKRSEDFSKTNILVKLPQCNSLIYSHKADRILYSDYTIGKMYSYDFTTYEGGNNYENQEELFQFTDALSARLLFDHPTGEYIYIVVPGRNAIMRSDYNSVTKQYSTPYIVCGGSGAGYADLIGINAKMDSPSQGVFVKNPDYKGRSDEYDFYFCDINNFCIRKLTPDGVVSTFAGRGSRSLNSQYYGYVDGDLREDARFNWPIGIAYDEESKAFYVADKTNYCIRKIAFEDGYAHETETNENQEGTNNQ